MGKKTTLDFPFGESAVSLQISSLFLQMVAMRMYQTKSEYMHWIRKKWSLNIF